MHIRFFDLTKLRRGTADQVLKTALEVLEVKNVTTNHMCGIATDGCNVMTGVCSGVTTQIKKINPFIVSTHCIAHCLALACGQAADGDRYLKRYQEMVNSIYKYHHYSCKHSENLKEIQNILDSAERKFKQVFHTRWLSFDGAVQAILANLYALITELIADGEREKSCKGYPSFYNNIFLMLLHIFSWMFCLYFQGLAKVFSNSKSILQL